MIRNVKHREVSTGFQQSLNEYENTMKVAQKELDLCQ